MNVAKLLNLEFDCTHILASYTSEEKIDLHSYKKKITRLSKVRIDGPK